MTGNTYTTSHEAEARADSYSQTYRSSYYASLWRDVEQPMIDRLLASYFPNGLERVVDVACGQGRITEFVAQRCKQAIGIDISQAMLSRAAICGTSAHYVRCDVSSDWPILGPVDLVTCFRFLLNAEGNLSVAALRRAAAHLSVSGGLLIANVHVRACSPLGYWYRATNRILRRTRARTLHDTQSRALLEESGFEVLHMERYGVLPRPLGLWSHGLDAVVGRCERIAHRHFPSAFRNAQCLMIVARPQVGRGA